MRKRRNSNHAPGGKPEGLVGFAQWAKLPTAQIEDLRLGTVSANHASQTQIMARSANSFAFPNASLWFDMIQGCRICDSPFHVI